MGSFREGGDDFLTGMRYIEMLRGWRWSRESGGSGIKRWRKVKRKWQGSQGESVAKNEAGTTAALAGFLEMNYRVETAFESRITDGRSTDSDTKILNSTVY